MRWGDVTARLRRARVAVLAGCAALTVGLAGCGDDEPAEPVPATMDGAVLDPWFEAMERSADEPARVVVMGDSVSEGLGLAGDLDRRWVDRLQVTLRTRVGAEACSTAPAGYEGTTSLVPAWYAGAALPDPPTSGPVEQDVYAGPGGRALRLLPGASISWEVTATSVDVGYRSVDAGGTMQISIDGEVVEQAIDTASDGFGARRVWSSDDLGPGRRTITVANVSAPTGELPVVVTDLTPFVADRDRCVHVLDASHSGIQAKDVAARPDYLADTLSLDPDLLVVPLGFNDAFTSTPAELGHSLRSLVGQVRQGGYTGPVLLVGLFSPPPGTYDEPWAEYLAAMHDQVSAEGVSYVDLSGTLPAVQGAPSGTYLDALHPAPAGHGRIAQVMADVLTPPPTPERVATSPARTGPSSPTVTSPVTEDG